MQEKINQLVEEALKVIDRIEDMNALMVLKSKYLGKKSAFNAFMKELRNLPNEEKPKVGQMVNQAKNKISDKINSVKNEIEAKKIEKQLRKETIDVTLPGKHIPLGRKHILTQTIEEIENIFIGLGYQISEGPEQEKDRYNFEMLNLPKDHPARDMQDSLYIDEVSLLRTHTSPVQVRTLLANADKKPVKIIAPGRVYRKDDDDQTHSHQFHQVEVLVVDEHANLADLKGTLLIAAQKLFGQDRKIRLRPSYFPFTEPSVEVDVSCYVCSGKGCSMCKHTGWIEILGAGMVNNNVLKAAGYDPDKFQGFAIGFGVERIAMLKYGIDDIRQLYTNDLRFNAQF